jgi:hypothetical protein
VGRPEPAGDQAEIGADRLGEYRLELVRPVADDRDPGRVDTQLERLRSQEGTVQICALTPDQLAAGDDDRGARPRRIRCPARQGRCRRM